MIKKKWTKLLAGTVCIFSLILLQPKEAIAYNPGGDGRIKFNSWDISNFNSTLDLWTQTRDNYDAEKVKGRVTYGDFDGNGKDEIVAFYDYGNSTTEIHRLYQGSQYYNESAWNSGAGNFNANSITNKVVAGDFNGDGKDEVVALYDYLNHTSTMFQFSLNGDKRTFSPKDVWDATGFDGQDVAAIVAGDFDGDRKDEVLIFYDYGSNKTGMFELKMNSNGKFISRYAWESTTYDASKIKGKTVAGDFNGDRKDEVAMFYDYGNAKTSIWSLCNQNNSYLATETWHGDTFNASKINDKVVSTHNKNKSKDKIVTFYDYSNNVTGVFTWDLQSNNKFTPKLEKELSNYEADRIAGRVAIGKFDGQTIRVAGMYDGTIVNSQTMGDKIVAEARKHLGKPYQWSGKGPDYFDCSGLVQYVFEQFGISLPAPTTNQVNYGEFVAKSDLQPGDLVFFNDTYDGPNPTHVGIYTGNGKFIEAGSTVVTESNLYSSYNISHYETARRIVK